MTDILNLDEFEQTEYEMVDVFTLNGKTYQISTKPRLNVALKFMKLQRSGENSDAAVGQLLEQMLGEEAYDALSDYDDLTPEMFNAVVAICAKTAMGGTDPKALKS